MHYMYVLRNEGSGEFYYGYTNNLERRVQEHNADQGKWKLVYYEAYLAEADARKREGSLKHYGQARTYLKARILESLKM